MAHVSSVPPKIPYSGFSPIRLQAEARTVSVALPKHAPSLSARSAYPWHSPGLTTPSSPSGPPAIRWHYQPTRLGPSRQPPRPTGPSLQEGYVVPLISALRPDAPVSTAPPDFPGSLVIQRVFALRPGMGCYRDLSHFHCCAFHTCRRPYAGGFTPASRCLRRSDTRLPPTIRESPPTAPVSASYSRRGNFSTLHRSLYAAARVFARPP